MIRNVSYKFMIEKLYYLYANSTLENEIAEFQYYKTIEQNQSLKE